MQKTTIIVCVDEPTEVATVQAWFSRWKGQLTFVSENQGCGCCVDIWEVQGPQEAFDELPPQIYSGIKPKHPQHATRNRIMLAIAGILVLCLLFAKVMSYRS